MANRKDVLVPDLGNVAGAEIIEVSVKPGDKINKDDPLITLESDKASMEIPAPFAGTIDSIKVKVGDKISAGDIILVMQTAEDDNKAPKAAQVEQAPPATAKAASSAETTVQEVKVPDIGSAGSVDVIEIHVQPGDTIAPEQTLITLEGDKATMEIPAPFGGKVKTLSIKVGDKVSTGSIILTVEAQGQAVTTSSPAEPKSNSAVATETKVAQPAQAAIPAENQSAISNTQAHAGPSVRRFARELGVDLNQVKGSGPKSRILKEDVHAYVKQRLATSQPAATSGAGLPSAPVVDFAKFGPIQSKPLNRIKKLTGINLSRNWLLVPHVTQFDEADITELEAFRKAQQASVEKQYGVKLTPLAFIMKAVVASLKAFPNFNASLDPTGDNLILKQYYHIGVAVDTPDGLVVPVIRDVDKKSVTELAKELGEVSAKARNKGLTAADMQGSTFTISSLGGIGGTAFTPIVNLPDVAILGISKSAMKPVYQEGQFVPRLMLPLSLSYDHRVIDGAEGARFIVHLSAGLADVRRLLL